MKRSIRVATSASYFSIPEVHKLLSGMDYIFTSNLDCLPFIQKMLPENVVIIYFSHGGQDMKKDSFLPIIEAHMKSLYQDVSEGIEVVQHVHFGMLMELGEKHLKENEEKNIGLHAKWMAYTEASDAYMYEIMKGYYENIGHGSR